MYLANPISHITPTLTVAASLTKVIHISTASVRVRVGIMVSHVRFRLTRSRVRERIGAWEATRCQYTH